MSERFSAAALYWAGVAARGLGWPPATFWAATPAELTASLDPALPAQAPPSREAIARMIERDANGR